jgi:hypothetical protein
VKRARVREGAVGHEEVSVRCHASSRPPWRWRPR